MTNRTITARSGTLAGVVAGATFTSGTATVDDSTAAGKKAIGFAKRQGWAVSGSIATAVNLTPAEGEAIERWTTAELKAYLDDKHVQYPSGTSDAELRKAIRDGFEVKAQGGSAANEGAGHTSGTIPPEGAPPVSNIDKPDDADVASKWVTPLPGNVANDVAPTISSQPSPASAYAGETATFEVTGAGTPSPTYQWERQALGTGDWVAIEGATADSYETPVLVTATNNGDKYRVVLDNTDGTLVSDEVALTVTTPTAPTISVQPTDQTVTTPTAATFSVTAAGDPTPDYQWQRQAAGSGPWVDIEGATSSSFVTPATAVTGGDANNTDKYRVVVTNLAGTVTSNAKTLTVNAI